MKRIANECFFAWVESEIKSGRSVKFRVKGNSMMPLLRNGKDEVVVGPYDKGKGIARKVHSNQSSVTQCSFYYRSFYASLSSV